MLTRLKLGPRLIGSYLMIALLCGTVGIAGIRAMRSINQVGEEASQRRVPSLRGLLLMMDGVQAVRRAEVSSLVGLLTKKEGLLNRTRKQIDDGLRGLDDGSRVYGPLARPGDEERSWTEFQEKASKWRELLARVTRLREARRADQTVALTYGEDRAAFLAVSDGLQDLCRLQDQATKRAQAEAESTLTTTTRLLWFAILASIAAAVAVGLATTRSILGPMAQVVEKVDHLAAHSVAGLETALLSISRGDLSKQVEDDSQPLGLNRQDELGSLAQSADRISTQVTSIVGAYRQMVANLSDVVGETQSLASAAREGRLSVRGDAGAHQGVFGELVQGINETLDGVVEPLQVAATYMERISRGDIPEAITQSYQGDFGQVEHSLNTCIGTLSRLMADMNAANQAQLAGDLDAYIPVDGYQGAYRTMAEGANAAVRTHVTNTQEVLELLGEYADGDLDRTLRRLPGKQAVIHQRMDLLRDNLQALVDQTRQLSQAALAGQTSARGDVDRFAGAYREVIQGLNDTLVAVVSPLELALDCMESF
ncbi:MAG TPA: MCP four helix bundle domain-containing protein, partial [Armatimonadota bacterium]